MAKIYTDVQDEQTIDSVLKYGLRASAEPKWKVLRLALARSLRLKTPPDEAFDHRSSAKGGGEYDFQQLTGEGQGEEKDYTALFCALLSVYHEQDLFAQEDEFRTFLQRHVRRGLREIRNSWRESHDFHEYLLQELFSDVSALAQPSQAENDDERLLKALSEIGITADVIEQIEGPRLTRFLVRLRDSNDLGSLRRGLDKLAFSLGLGDSGVFLSTTQEPKVCGLDVPRHSSRWQYAEGTEFRAWLDKAPTDWRLPVYIGQDVTGQPFGFDLAQAPHILVGGTTGSGKSVCLHAIVLSLLAKHSAKSLQLVLIDPKRVELNAYQGLPHISESGILTDTADALAELNNLVIVMEEREKELARVGARDIDAVAAKNLEWPRIIVVVEELADLILQSGAIEAPLVRLAQKARATGIHLLLATQRPDAQTFSGLLRSNIPSRIALTVQKAAESRIILDEQGAEKLLGRGDMLVKLIGTSPRRVHGVFITPDDIALGVASAKRGAG